MKSLGESCWGTEMSPTDNQHPITTSSLNNSLAVVSDGNSNQRRYKRLDCISKLTSNYWITCDERTAKVFDLIFNFRYQLIAILFPMSVITLGFKLSAMLKNSAAFYSLHRN